MLLFYTKCAGKNVSKLAAKSLFLKEHIAVELKQQ